MRSTTPIEDRVGLSSDLRAQLEEAVQQQGTLSDVVRWMARVGGMELLLVVEQDEFTNDVVLQWCDGLYLIYDCT